MSSRDEWLKYLFRFAQTIRETSCETVVISSEALDALLRNSEYAKSFFNRLGELNLEPKLVVFPRNQSQAMNSRYAQVVKSFCRSTHSEAFVQAQLHHPTFTYSHWIGFADAFDAELIPRPFNKETLVVHMISSEFYWPWALIYHNSEV